MLSFFCSEGLAPKWSYPRIARIFTDPLNRSTLMERFTDSCSCPLMAEIPLLIRFVLVRNSTNPLRVSIAYIIVIHACNGLRSRTDGDTGQSSKGSPHRDRRRR